LGRVEIDINFPGAGAQLVSKCNEAGPAAALRVPKRSLAIDLQQRYG